MRLRKRTRLFTRKITTSVEHGEGLYLVEVTFRCYPGNPGRTYGDPEDCYPSESAFGEVEDILVLDIEDGGDFVMVGQHVDWDINTEELITCVLEAQTNADEAEYETWCESKLDIMREENV